MSIIFFVFAVIITLGTVWSLAQESEIVSNVGNILKDSIMRYEPGNRHWRCKTTKEAEQKDAEDRAYLEARRKRLAEKDKDKVEVEEKKTKVV